MIQNWSPCVLLVGSESEAVTLGNNMTVPANEKKSNDISVWNSDFICVCKHLCVLLCVKENRKFKRTLHICVHISIVHKCLRCGSNTSGYECISNVWFYSGKGLLLSFKKGRVSGMFGLWCYYIIQSTAATKLFQLCYLSKLKQLMDAQTRIVLLRARGKHWYSRKIEFYFGRWESSESVVCLSHI